MDDDKSILTHELEQEGLVTPKEIETADYNAEVVSPAETVAEDQDITEVPNLAEERERIEREKAELAKKQKDLQKGFDKIAREKRELEAKLQPSVPDEDDVPDLDPTAQKALDKYFQSKYGNSINTLDAMVNDLYTEAIIEVAQSKGLEADELDSVIQREGLRPEGMSARAFKNLAEKGARLIEPVETMDELRARIAAEEREKILKEMGEGVTIDALKPKRAESAPMDSPAYFDDMEPAAKIAFWKAKGILPDD